MSKVVQLQDSRWKELLLFKVTKKGQNVLIDDVENAIVILQCDHRWRGRVKLDTFTYKIVLDNPPWNELQGGSKGTWTDTDWSKVHGWLLREYNLKVGQSDIISAVAQVAERNEFHSTRDKLEAMKWDGVKRVDTWLSEYLGTTDNPYTRNVGKWWLVSAVARAYSPGCKADHMLILEGSQGAGKSTSIDYLTGDLGFSDTPLELSNKDSYQQVQGKLVIELAEMSSLRSADKNRAKAFFSSRMDCFRKPYGAGTADVPRGCVFIGTVNPSQYLSDETGNRRYWPVKCINKILPSRIKDDRLQLWAEAVAMYKAGTNWFPETEEEFTLCSGEQEKRDADTPWSDYIEKYLVGKDSVAVADILSEALGVKIEHQTPKAASDVAKVLRKMKWERRRLASGTKRTWCRG